MPSAVHSLLSYRQHSRNEDHKRVYEFPSKIIFSTSERMCGRLAEMIIRKTVSNLTKKLPL